MGWVYTGSGKIRVECILGSDKIRIGCISILRVSDQPNGSIAPFFYYFTQKLKPIIESQINRKYVKYTIPFL